MSPTSVPPLPKGPSSEQLYGRRIGRPLRKQRASLLETLLPQLALTPAPQEGPLDPATLFSPAQKDLWVEVGFGGGEHVAAQAAMHPDVGIIGAEFFINGVANLLQHVQAQSLTNVRIVNGDARPLLDALPPASVGRAFVLFADPWPKARHARRRFIGPDNLPRLARALRQGAELRIATDDPTLQAWTEEQMAACPTFDLLSRTDETWPDRPADWPATRYEQKALDAGRHPLFFRFVRNDTPWDTPQQPKVD